VKLVKRHWGGGLRGDGGALVRRATQQSGPREQQQGIGDEREDKVNGNCKEQGVSDKRSAENRRRENRAIGWTGEGRERE